MVVLKESPSFLFLKGDYNELQMLKRECSFKPDGYHFSPQFKLYQHTGGKKGWNGTISLMQWMPKHKCWRISRGHKKFLLGRMEALDIEYDGSALWTSPLKEATSDDIESNLIQSEFELDEDQRKSVAAWLSSSMGVNKISVNGGKTAIFATAAAALKCHFPDIRCLFITQSERLVNQAKKDMDKFLPDWHITQYGGGVSTAKINRRDNTGKDLVISTVAILNKNFKQLVADGWFHSFHAILFDEVHHCTSPSAKKVLGQIPAFFRFGASDTVREDDVAKGYDIEGMFGPRLITVLTDKTIDLGRSAKPHIYVVKDEMWYNACDGIGNTPELESPAKCLIDGKWRNGVYRGPVTKLDDEGKIVYTSTNVFEEGKVVKKNVPVTVNGFHNILLDGDGEPTEVPSRWCLLERAYDTSIIRFKPRNELIGEWAKHFHDLNYPTIVVATRTLHILVAQAYIKKAGVPADMVRVLYSEHSTGERNNAFEWLSDTPGSILITPLMKEGVSINAIRAGIVADYVGDYELGKQIVGRMIRKKEVNNECHVVWFSDVQHPTYRRGSRKVVRKLKENRLFAFYDDVQGPSTVSGAKFHDALGDFTSTTA